MFSGNAFSADAVWAIVKQWLPECAAPLVMVSEPVRPKALQCLSAEEQWAVYSSWTEQEMVEYLEGLAVGLKMPELDLDDMVSNKNQAPYQTSAPGYCKPGLESSCEYAVDSTIRDLSLIHI